MILVSQWHITRLSIRFRQLPVTQFSRGKLPKTSFSHSSQKSQAKYFSFIFFSCDYSWVVKEKSSMTVGKLSFFRRKIGTQLEKHCSESELQILENTDQTWFIGKKAWKTVLLKFRFWFVPFYKFERPYFSIIFWHLRNFRTSFCHRRQRTWTS